MASSSVEINKKRCIKCDGEKSGGGLFTCDGCQQMFCRRHVNEHREGLSLQLEHAIQEHDLIQQESNQFALDQSVLEEINSWEKKSIEKIQRTADVARAEFQRWQRNTKDQFKKKCNEIAANIRIARETDDFSEPDLVKWNKVLTDLKKQLESMAKINITEDKRACINLIKIQEATDGPTDIPVRMSRRQVAEKSSVDGINRPSSNRQRATEAEIFSRPRRITTTHSDDNPDNQKQVQCKQQ